MSGPKVGALLAVVIILLLGGILAFQIAGRGTTVIIVTPTPDQNALINTRVAQTVSAQGNVANPPANVTSAQVAAAPPSPTPVPVQQAAPSATNTPLPQPTATTAPAPTNTPVPPPPPSTPVPQPSATTPQVQSFDSDRGVCNTSSGCTIPSSIGPNQVVLVHGDINHTGSCHYHVYMPGQTIPDLGTGKYRVKLIQGPQTFIDSSVKNDVAGAAAEVGGSCPPLS